MRSLPSTLVTALCRAAGLMMDADRPWWVIAGAATAIHGADPVAVRDIDLLIDRRDVARLRDCSGFECAPRGDNRKFRSRWLARVLDAPLPIELMSGFEVFDGDRWVNVAPMTREAYEIGDVLIYVPAREELTAMLRLFGRPKDDRRICELAAFP